MATIENTLARPEHNLLTRRAALRGTAAAGTMVLPAGVALAAARRTDSLADDPSLARLEAGYARWQALVAEKDDLRARRDELHDRARADRPALTPEPARSDYSKDQIRRTAALG